MCLILNVYKLSQTPTNEQSCLLVYHHSHVINLNVFSKDIFNPLMPFKKGNPANQNIHKLSFSHITNILPILLTNHFVQNELHQMTLLKATCHTSTLLVI